MSYDTRVDAARYRNEQEYPNQPGIYRMGSGFRVEHLRQQLTEIFQHAREGFDGHHGHDDLEERIRERGVKISTLRKVFDGYSEHRGVVMEGVEVFGVEFDQDGRFQRDESEFEVRKFPAEYIGMADFRVLESGANLSTLSRGTYYKDRASAEMDGTWGIVIDLEMVKNQLEEILKEEGSVPDELFGALFMFHLFHEHFHYLSELAAMKLSGFRERFTLYEEYLKNANWGKWFCKLDECSRVNIRDEWKFVPFKTPKCMCGLGGIMTAEIGYQYPVEEAMANAHASKCLMRLLGKHTGYNGLMPYITEFIKDHHPLGYAEFECFRAGHRFNLGQRIMTRLLRGDVSMPDTNILQHELIEKRPLRQIKVNEEERFSGLLQTENAYNSPIIPDDMAEVPVYILNCNKFPQWGMYIDQFLS